MAIHFKPYFSVSCLNKMIIWGSRKLFGQNEKKVRQAIGHPLLARTKLIGRGAYSMIFLGASNVFKLTTDRVSYELAESQMQWQCASLPKVIGLHGQIGTTDGGLPLFLMAIERLEKLVLGSEQRKLCLSIGRRVRQNSGRCETVTEQLRETASFAHSPHLIL